MSAQFRSLHYVLLTIAWIVAAGFVKAGPVDDLLPPPTRQVEKRSLGANDDRIRQAQYGGHGGFGASFSPDG
jgi:hypothetical protein